tara:strand:- start:39 stop:323 length:285 start_codon:yes stop_codon:yes gene_type:complete
MKTDGVTIKITKEQWEILELLEWKVNGGYNGTKLIKGMFDDIVYEVNRGSVDSNLNLIEKNEYLVTIYNYKLFGKFFKKIKSAIWTIWVTEEDK